MSSQRAWAYTPALGCGRAKGNGTGASTAELASDRAMLAMKGGFGCLWLMVDDADERATTGPFGTSGSCAARLFTVFAAFSG